MTALDQSISTMLKNLKNIPEGEYGELLNLEQYLEPGDPDDFMETAPDTIDEDIPIEQLAQTTNLLGCYYLMRSPGKVVMFTGNLKRFFDSLLLEVLKATPYVTKKDLEVAARLVVLKTWHHELFHFDCNVMRVIFGTPHDRLKEEALAVAWSRIKIAEERAQWNSLLARMNGVIYGVLMDRAYRYRSAGYCDWSRYADETSFKSGMLDYIQPQNFKILTQSGVPLQDMLFSLLGKGKSGQGFIELAV